MIYAYKLKDPTIVTPIGNKIITKIGSLITTDLQTTVDLMHYGLLEPVKNVVDANTLVSAEVPECRVRWNKNGTVSFSPAFPHLDKDSPFMGLEEYKLCVDAYTSLIKLLKPA